MSDNLRLHLFESGFLPPVLLVLMVAMVEIGWRTGTFAFAKATTTELSDDKTLIGAIFGLLALLIAFTFSGAANRFDDRRHLIVDEVRAIADAYRSLDFLQKEQQPAVRQLFLSYVDHRLALYQNMADTQGFEQKVAAQAELSNQLWQASLAATRATDAAGQSMADQVPTAILKMIDASENQRLGMKFHPPRVIWQSLVVLALIGSFMSGYIMGIQQKRDWLVTLVFATLMAGAVYVILNIEYPRVGSINLDDFDQELVSLRKTM